MAEEEKFQDSRCVVDVVSSLEMLSVRAVSTTTSCDAPGSASCKMVLRKRIRKAEASEIHNRRCSLKPRKRPFVAVDSSDDEVKKYYLDKNLGQNTNTLETIYEEADGISETTSIAISSKRFKRLIQFDRQASDAKIRKRRAKIKKVFGSRVTKHRYASMQTLINRLNKISTDSPVKDENGKSLSQAKFFKEENGTNFIFTRSKRGTHLS